MSKGGCVSRLSCGDVPFLSRTFCPIDVELHNLSGRGRCPGTPTPQDVPGTLPRHTNHQIPLCGLCLSVFSSPCLQTLGFKDSDTKTLKNEKWGI